MKYVYVNNQQGKYEKGVWVAPVVFECTASSISDADILYKEKMGQAVEKQPHIACKISA